MINRLIFLNLLLSLNLFGQTPIYTNYQHYTTEHGLPQNYVSSIVQDKDGYIWVGTLDGIARFDGKNFIEFNITSEGKKQISTPRVLDLKVDENNLWILHFNQTVDVLNLETFQVKRDVKPISTAEYDSFPLALGYKSMFYFTFAEDLDNHHWFVKNDLSYLTYDTADYKLLKLFSQKKDSSNYYFGYNEDDQGRLWLIDRNGLVVSNSNWENFKSIKPPEDLKFDIDSLTSLSLITHLTKGRVLIFTNERLMIYDEPLNEFREIKLPIKRKQKANHATIATKDPEGRVVFKYYGYIFRVNDDESISTLWKFPERDRFLISSLLVARDGTLWAGVNTGGLYRINTLIPSFQSKKYSQNFLVDLLINEMGVVPNQIPANWYQNKGSYDLRYFYSENGRLYFTQDGYYFGRLNRIFYLEDNHLRLVKSKASGQYFRGFHDHDGFLSAIGSYGDYYMWENVDSIPEITKCIDLSKPNYFGLVNSTYADGFTWVLDNQNRIYQLNKGKILKTYEVGDKNFGLIELCKDPASAFSFWIATYGGGLLKWNYRKDTIEKVLTKREGLPDNTIASMILDNSGDIWMSTFNGVTRFNPEKEYFTNYSTSDGLIQSEFDRYHGFKLPDGKIAFGGSQGYSVFNPQEFVEDVYNPKVLFAQLSINNEPQLFGDSLSLIQVPLNQLKSLALDYQHNSISIELATNQYNNPDKIRYRFKLSGYHSDWVNNGFDRNLKFEKLQTGNYTLFLNASNTNGVWSKNVKETYITVLPPPWLSWWAYSGYILILGSVVIVYWRKYRNNLIRKQEEEFNRREAIRLKEVDDIKTRFFSNITHEFRTPLTLILSPLEKQLREKKYPVAVQKILESNYRHGSHLLKLVNELLDISKLESGFMPSHKSTGQLTIFVRQCLEQFHELAQKKQINLSYDVKNVEGYYHFDKSHWEKIISNLIGNSIKFTPEGGNVLLWMEEIPENKILIQVKDTGIGISQKHLPKLFDRFYQVDDTTTRVYEGTGIGLSLVKELVELLDGEIKAESTVGKGSCFTLKMPIDKIDDKTIFKSEAKTADNYSKKSKIENSAIILVVEDNPELREFIAESLKNSFIVLQAENGRSGLEHIQNQLPDIVISDVMMPQMNGYDLCRASKADPRTSHIHFILLTAKTAQESKVIGLESGADDYLTKPFQIYELELRIQNALQQQENLRKKLNQELLPENPLTSTPIVTDVFLARLYQYLDEHLTNQSLGVEVLAKEMAMSQSTLNRKLKALLNLSAVEFIQKFRLQRALELIPSGEPISNIAFKVGFESPAYFTQCFKAAYQMTPTEFRNKSI